MTRNDSQHSWNAAMADWLSRRRFLAGVAATGGAAAMALPLRQAEAKTTITWMGWQGYETPIKSGTFLTDNDIDFQPTFIAS
ncbi:MAG TPA: twin-arginine translocation signal domain-containing protein, partial [Candidatus Angelobacter sp.]|nr:twin-arginine translocation signal domain-containing protein [Candidatus Angelobacter sp.]